MIDLIGNRPLTPAEIEYGKTLATEAAYYEALNLVAEIDEPLTKGTRHYRNTAGELLTTLDQVVVAILAGELKG